MVAIVATISGMPRKPLPPSTKKVPFAGRCDPAALAAIQELADADERTLSFMIERAIREFVERHGKANAGGKSKGKP